MNAITNFTKDTSIKEELTLELNGIKNDLKISEYNKQEHKKWSYNDDFIYIHDKKTDKIFVIENLELSYFKQIKKILETKDFEVFCYSKKNTWTSYNSYIPVDWGIILQFKAKIQNALDLNK